MLAEHPLLGPHEHRLLLCHGIATQSKPPHARMGHAWLEEQYGDLWFVRDRALGRVIKTYRQTP